MKKITPSQSIQQFLQMDIWIQRKVGRGAALGCLTRLIKQLQQDMPQHKHTLAQVLQQERLAIKACDSKDQQAWDKANAESTRLTNIIKAAQ